MRLRVALFVLLCAALGHGQVISQALHAPGQVVIRRVAPVLLSVSPSSGLVASSATLTGTGFGLTQENTTLTLTGVAVTATAWSDTSVTFTVPTTTTGSLVMVRGGLTSNALTFTVTSASPAATPCTDAATAGTILYTKTAATGTGTGADWTNARALPNTTAFVRGKVYCIAGGSYGSKTFSTATSGASSITIAKATVADHGTATGWSDPFGTTQAAFDDFSFSSANWVIDGSTGGGPGAWDTGFGIKITMPVSGGQTHVVDTTTSAATFTLRHIEIQGRGRNYGTGDTDFFYLVNGYSGITLSYCYFHDTDRTMILSWPAGTATGMTIEYSLFARNGALEHREAWSFGIDSNVIVRYNIFEDIYGTGFLAGVNNIGTAQNWDVYGNVFTHSSLTKCVVINGGAENGNTWCGTLNTGIFVCGAGLPSFNIHCTNWHVYNNVIAHVGGNAPITAGFDLGGGATTFVTENNLWYANTGAAAAGGTTTDYNWFFANVGGNGTSGSHDVLGSANPFVDAAPWDTRTWTLRAAISGLALTAPYDHDFLGVLRGGDGVWDRGALEFP